jgi:DNA-binding winged helix-turn-helix (wHTH) protein
MSTSLREQRTQKFGEFVVDCRAGELYRRGKKIKVQLQPMQVLLALLEKPGDIVTREELRQKIWPADTFVDFEHSLNTAIKKLRQALGDRAAKSKFVETLPRRGYRFLPEVESSEQRPSTKPAKASRLEGKVVRLTAEEGNECVVAPADTKAFEEWSRLKQLGDDVGVAMMITDKRLLLLSVGQTVRILGLADLTGWCEARILEGEHYGKTALIHKESLQVGKENKPQSV